jgi:hypothetical protein
MKLAKDRRRKVPMPKTTGKLMPRLQKDRQKAIEMENAFRRKTAQKSQQRG